MDGGVGVGEAAGNERERKQGAHHRVVARA
jgi:hypothetical protein